MLRVGVFVRRVICFVLLHQRSDFEIEAGYEDKNDGWDPKEGPDYKKLIVKWYCARCQKVIDRKPWGDSPPRVQNELIGVSNDFRAK